MLPLGPMRILVVEDYKPIRKSITQALREIDYAVDEAEDGEEALWLSKTEHYDVIVLDLMLPKKHGLDVLKELRKSNTTVHVLILSAIDGLDDRIKGLDRGADD